MRKLIAAVVLVVSALPALGNEVLPFIENDFQKAVTRAKAKNEPIFVDAWAPW